MGKRYTREEIDQIHTLTNEGLTDHEIATRLDRTADGIRNIRHRKKLRADIRESLESLIQKEMELNKRVSYLQREIKIIEIRREKISQVLDMDGKTLNLKLYAALEKLKDEKPELFEISLQEQIGKIAAEFTIDFLKWIVS